jgi:hypothetical protein
MATFEQRDQSGALFKNDKKTEPKHPDYQGDCMVNGKKMRMSAWLKESAKGKFMSLAFSEPYEPSARNAAPSTPPSNEPKPSGFDDFEDDIPF